jgi:hypothetical protein
MEKATFAVVQDWRRSEQKRVVRTIPERENMLGGLGWKQTPG